MGAFIHQNFAAIVAILLVMISAELIILLSRKEYREKAKEIAILAFSIAVRIKDVLKKYCSKNETESMNDKQRPT